MVFQTRKLDDVTMHKYTEKEPRVEPRATLIQGTWVEKEEVRNKLSGNDPQVGRISRMQVPQKLKKVINELLMTGPVSEFWALTTGLIDFDQKQS